MPSPLNHDPSGLGSRYATDADQLGGRPLKTGGCGGRQRVKESDCGG